MIKTKSKINWQNSLLATLALILLIVTASFIVSRRINGREEQRSFDTLYQEAAFLVQNIENQVASDREQLEMLATVAGSFSDPQDPKLWSILDSYTAVGMMSDLSMLLPDGTIIFSGTESIDSSGFLSFRDIAAKGAHISGRETSLITGAYLLRHYVPVVRNGETIAMLYGIVDLETLPKDLTFSLYGGKAAVYIIDGETGDFLLDTWHAGDDLGNFWDMGERPLAAGYDKKAFEEGLFSGVPGHVVFRSNSAGTYLYYHYTPMNINQWRLAISVPEAVVFSSANQIRTILNLFLAFEAACFLFYLLWMLRYILRETGEKQRQVDTIHNVYNVAKLLFSAHEHQENIAPALKRIAHSTGGSAVSFWVDDLGEDGLFFSYHVPGSSDAAKGAMPDYIPALLKLFQAGKRIFEAYDPAALSPLFPNGVPKGTAGLAAIPLEDLEGTFCGILAVENPQRDRTSYSLLRSMCFSFSMLCQNLRSYGAIRTQGETDALTGVLNRNRYEQDLPNYRQWYRDSLACVYIDTNGLHELNNTLGHEAGDHMLRRTAAEILRRFGKTHSYRIGGDEFVIFAPDMPEAEVSHLCQELESVLMAENIHVSIGIRWADAVPDLTQFIQGAEGQMYAAKRAYYALHDRQQRSRLPKQ